ncbi:MAG: exopolyphosphatase / guanosine-5-triphosphate,3-diphosphate pyrophosphatase [Clostridiales bacterium]|jgi:exopolyphosphatase/guanosine-5'-triphosphate,3'-diphosphate pyrophosphatase|nr:exopolyphosphatase / guanosine-5-triphosphate,3-diphosphate pyrophosphatase [Clostridiales bacterium]
MDHLFAAIDFGSNALKLKIIQMVSGEIEVLEDLSVPIRLGDEVYLSDVIKLDTVKKAVDILLHFKRIMDDYGVKIYKAMATSALRDAENSKSIIEIIRMKTGFEIEVVEDTVEKFLTYKSMRDRIPNYKEVRKSAVLVEVNTGGFDVSLYSQNKLVKNDEIKLGIKELKYILMDLEKRTTNYPNVLKELIQTRTSHLFPFITIRRPNHFLAVGGEVKTIREVIFDGKSIVHMAEFKETCERAKRNDYDLRRRIERRGSNWYEFLATMLVYDVFTDLVKCETLLIPDISLRDGILAELTEQRFELTKYRDFNNDIYTLTGEISKRYKSSEPHVKYLERTSLQFLRALKDYYGFHERDFLLLRLAANLHEIGKFTRIRDYLDTTYEKISNLDIFGLEHKETLLIAHVCRLISSSERKHYTSDLRDLSDDEQIRVYKLAAILSVADALDKGKKQKIRIRKLEVTEDAFLIFVTRKEDAVLEEWSFRFTVENFENTFGIRPELRDFE